MTVKIEGRYGDMARFSWFFNNNKNNLDQDKNQKYFLHILIVSKIPNCSSLNAYEHLKVVTVLLFNMICDWVWLCQKKRTVGRKTVRFWFLFDLWTKFSDGFWYTWVVQEHQSILRKVHHSILYWLDFDNSREGFIMCAPLVWNS